MTDTTKPITDTLVFKADFPLAEIEESMGAIGVLMRSLKDRGDPDTTLIEPVFAILEDMGHDLRNLRELIEGDAAASPSNADRPSDMIKRSIFDLDDLIGRCDVCSTTMGKLTDYVEAGHAVAGIVQGLGCGPVTIVPDDDGEALGSATVANPLVGWERGDGLRHSRRLTRAREAWPDTDSGALDRWRPVAIRRSKVSGACCHGYFLVFERRATVIGANFSGPKPCVVIPGRESLDTSANLAIRLSLMCAYKKRSE